jgi:hypothetical protein
LLQGRRMLGRRSMGTSSFCRSDGNALRNKCLRGVIRFVTFKLVDFRRINLHAW